MSDVNAVFLMTAVVRHRIFQLSAALGSYYEKNGCDPALFESVHLAEVLEQEVDALDAHLVRTTPAARKLPFDPISL